MKRQIASELRKLTTTRSSYSMFAGLLVLMTLAAVATVVDNDLANIRVPLQEQPFLQGPLVLLVSMFALLFGIRSFTDEFRSGSIVPTLLATPNRARVLAAKLAATAAGGIAMAAAAAGIALAVGVPLLIGRDVAITWSTSELLTAGGRLLVASVLWTSIGVGFGLAVRHQVAAIAGALIWMLTIENMLSAFFPDVMRYFPGQLGASLTGVDALELLAPAAAAAALAGWATLATITGAALMRRRDIA